MEFSADFQANLLVGSLTFRHRTGLLNLNKCLCNHQYNYDFSSVIKPAKSVKMPDICSAYACSNERSIQTRSHGITFHRFPKDGGLRRRWERAVRRAGFVVTRRSLLCSEHFKPEDFDRTGQTVRLRPEVIPSVFNFPTSLRKQVTARTTLPAKTAEESPLEDLTRLSSEVKPQTNVDHNYALPLKTRLSEALLRMEHLEQHNAKTPELRAKKNLHSVPSKGEEAP